MCSVYFLNLAFMEVFQFAETEMYEREKLAFYNFLQLAISSLNLPLFYNFSSIHTLYRRIPKEFEYE